MRAREWADLHEQRLVARHSQPAEDLGDLARSQVAVPLRERVDRRWNDEHRDVEPALEARQREDGGVVLIRELTERGPGVGPGSGAVDVTAPDPPAGVPGAHEAGRLAVVDGDQVRLEVELLAVEAVHVGPAREPLLARPALGALERRLERARRRVVAGVAARGLPARVDAQLGEDRHRGAQGLGRAAAETPAGHVQNAAALDLLGEPQHEVHGAGPGDAAVVVDPAHPRPSSSASSTNPRSRPRTRSSVVRYGSTRSNRSASSGMPSASRSQVEKASARRPRTRVSTVCR